MNDYSAITPLTFSQPSCLEALKNANQQNGTNNDTKTLKNLSRDFEAILVNFAIKAMWQTIPKSDLLDGNNDGMDIYTDIMQTALSQDITAKGGLGIAPAIYQHLAKGKDQNNVYPTSSVGATKDGCPCKGGEKTGVSHEQHLIK